jgi:low affinity Fe/Cu permease
MDFSSKTALIAVIFVLTFVLNLYFGFLRSKTKKFSLKWFLYIHLPIPVVLFARIFSNIDIRYIPIFLLAAVTGQILGGRLEF